MKKEKVRVRKHQIWADKATGRLIQIMSKHGDHWNVAWIPRTKVAHKIREDAINRYYELQ